MEYNFGNNFRKSIDFTSKNLKEYVKTDFRYLIVPFLMLFGFIISIGYGIVIFLENKGKNLNLLGPPILLAVLFLLIFFSWLVYVISWLIHSKTYHVSELYRKSETKYNESLNQTVKSRRRVFIGSLISGLISFSLLIVLNLILEGLLFLVLNRTTLVISLFPLLLYIEIIPSIIIGFFLVPLEIYPSVLLIEKDLGYIEGIKRSFHILKGWTNKIKFFLLAMLLIYIVNFILEFVLIGVLFGSIFVIVIVIFTLHLTGYTALLTGIVLFALVISFLLMMVIEIEGIVLGNFYGQSYVNLVHPDLEYGPVKKTDVQQYYSQAITYCTNCGQQLTAVQMFCPNCGQKR